MKNEAKWNVKTHIISDDEYECSNCGYKTTRPQNDCPNCDSRMTGKDKDLHWVEEAAMFEMFFG